MENGYDEAGFEIRDFARPQFLEYCTENRRLKVLIKTKVYFFIILLLWTSISLSIFFSQTLQDFFLTSMAGWIMLPVAIGLYLIAALVFLELSALRLGITTFSMLLLLNLIYFYIIAYISATTDPYISLITFLAADFTCISMFLSQVVLRRGKYETFAQKTMVNVINSLFLIVSLCFLGLFSTQKCWKSMICIGGCMFGVGMYITLIEFIIIVEKLHNLRNTDSFIIATLITIEYLAILLFPLLFLGTGMGIFLQPILRPCFVKLTNCIGKPRRSNRQNDIYDYNRFPGHF